MKPYSCLLLVPLYSLIIYPTWYTPTNQTADKLLFFNIFYFSILLIGWLIKWFVDNPQSINWGKIPSPPGWFYVVCLIHVVGTLPFISYPVIPGMDSHFHTAFPAAVIFKLSQIIEQVSGDWLSLHLLTWLGSFLLMAFLFQVFYSNSKFQTKFKLRHLLYLYPVLLIVAVLFSRNLVLHDLGEILNFHRYPPIGKTLFSLMYGLFGISEWGGRVTQITFTLGTAYVIYAFLIHDSISISKSQRVISVVLFLFNPWVWNIFFLNHLMMGNVFFITLSLYTFYQWHEQESDGWLLFFFVALVSGVMYKRLVLVIFPTVFLYLLLVDRDQSFTVRLKKIVRSLFIPSALIFPYLVYVKMFNFAPSSLVLKHVTNPLELFEPLALIPVNAGYALAIVLVLSCVWQFLRGWQTTPVNLFLVFLLTELLFIGISPAWGYMRHMMPVIVPLSLIGGRSLAQVYSFNKIGRVMVILVCGVILIEFGYLNFWSPDVELVNYQTQQYYALPYDSLTQYLKENNLEDQKIYAPMAVEPSHFYFYKNGLNFSRDKFVREFWADDEDQTINGLREFLRDGKFNYMIVPGLPMDRKTRYSGYLRNEKKPGFPGAGSWWEGYVKPRIHQKLYRNYESVGFKLRKRFHHGTEELLLLSVNNRRKRG